MLIRFVVNNILSFGKEKEFNMLPMPRLKRLNEHKYQINNNEVLKMAAIYGANGAGKSNLIRALIMLNHIVENEEIPSSFAKNEFKFNNKLGNMPLTFVIEFFQENKTFIYGIEILNNTVLTEELYTTDSKDELLFERKTDIQTKITTINSPLFDANEQSKTLKKVIEKNLSKPNKIVFRNLTIFNEPYLKDIETALNWFDKTLQIIMPNSKPTGLAYKLDTDIVFKQYTETTMQAFNIGIESINCQKITLDDFFDGNQDKISKINARLDESPSNLVSLRELGGDEIIFSKENNVSYARQLKIEHKGKDNIKAMFDLDEESDGTLRLLDLIPAFHEVVNKGRVCVIDEMERSIHPILIKELVRKFSADQHTNGQLIFTTHESNLLDQDIFRQDEIWFVEKDKEGCSDLYPLSDYKEHNTIDIRKGYLTGRYGSIPFLANLADLNWHRHAIKE